MSIYGVCDTCGDETKDYTCGSCEMKRADKAEAERDQLKKAIESFGSNPAGFDWAVLERIDQLEEERDRLRLVEQGAGDDCPVCAWRGIRGNDPCAFCEVERLKVERNELTSEVQRLNRCCETAEWTGKVAWEQHEKRVQELLAVERERDRLRSDLERARVVPCDSLRCPIEVERDSLRTQLAAAREVLRRVEEKAAECERKGMLLTAELMREQLAAILGEKP